MNCANHFLCRSIFAQCLSSSPDPAVEVASETIRPFHTHSTMSSLVDDVVAVLDQHHKKIEDLWLHGDKAVVAPDLVGFTVDRVRSDPVSHW